MTSRRTAWQRALALLLVPLFVLATAAGRVCWCHGGGGHCGVVGEQALEASSCCAPAPVAAADADCCAGSDAAPSGEPEGCRCASGGEASADRASTARAGPERTPSVGELAPLAPSTGLASIVRARPGRVDARALDPAAAAPPLYALHCALRC